MIDRTVCPDRQRLESLLLGQLTAADSSPLEEHLGRCRRCSDLLGSLRADDPLLTAVRGAASEEVLEYQRQADAFVPWLKRLRHDDEATRPPLPSDAHATLSWRPKFDFLAAPAGPDELGRLGRFVIREALGAGGMGMVFLADDPNLGRRVALKVVRPELLEQHDARRRFFSEARAVAKVEHDHIVAVHEVNEENGVPYLVMPLLRGESLEDRLKRDKQPPSIDEVLRLGREVAAGLAAAHAAGLIHRDIKPANIFLSADSGRALLLDFGLAQAVSEAADGPDVGKVVGTPAYMAPEQASSKPIDARADLFSLGCVLYRVATGQRPFQGADLLSVLLAVTEHDPEPPEKLRPDLPPDVAGLITALLAKEPDQRPASAHAVVETITAIERRRHAPRRWPWLLAAAVVTTAAVALALWLKPPPKPIPVEPAEVTFTLDEPEQTIFLLAGDEPEMAIDLKMQGTQTLAPGTYLLRAARPVSYGLQRTITLEPGEKRPVALQLVGVVAPDINCRLPVRAHLACGGEGAGLVVLSASDDLGVWKPFSGEERSTFLNQGKDKNFHADELYAVAMTRDGKWAATGGGKSKAQSPDTAVRVWNVATTKVTEVLGGDGEDIKALAISGDGKRVLSGDRAGELVLWDVPARTPRKWPGHARPGGVEAVDLSPDGRSALSAGDDGCVALWDVTRGQRIRQHEEHGRLARTVRFSPDGARAASGGANGHIVLWDLKTDARQTVTAAHEHGVFRVVFSPDGRRLLSGGGDGHIRLWDVASGKQIESGWKTSSPTVLGLAFTPDGRRAVSGGRGRPSQLWELPRENLTRRVGLDTAARRRHTHHLPSDRDRGAVP